MRNSLTEKWIVCRICLKKPRDPMQVIFNENDEDKDLTQMILQCGGVPIKKFDHYPDKICSKCLRYLRIAYKFRVTCQGSHKQLSRLIAPVVVDKSDVESDDLTPAVTMELDDAEAEGIALKLEPDDVLAIKQEMSEFDDDDVIDVYKPMDEDDIEALKIEALERGGTPVSDEIEYLDEIGDEFSTSDEEFIPNAKAAQKKMRKPYIKSLKSKSPKQVKKFSNQKPTTSRRAGLIKSEKPGKRGPKPKKIKETSFICDICGNIYPSQGRLTEHIKLHKGIKPHECEICGYAFAQTQQLARHMNTHTGNRPYKCNYCPAAFADLSTRNKHHRIHTNERPYVCDVCGKAFTYTNTLKFHKMIHTGEKPHVCDVCGKGFQQAYKLRNHKLTHEKKVGVKLEKIEVETLTNYEEVSVAAAQILEI